MGLGWYRNLESQKLTRQKFWQLLAIVRSEIKGSNIASFLDFGDNLEFSKSIPRQVQLLGFNFAPIHDAFDLRFQQLPFEINFFLTDRKDS